MRLPFTVGEFFDVFTRYNHAVWPMQYLLLALAVAVLCLVYLSSRHRSRIIGSILALLWGWMGLVYHIFHFTPINPAAWFFGFLFLVQAGLIGLLTAGINRLEFHRPSGWSVIVGWTLLVYGLIIYPLIGMLTGLPYMSSPTFGAPCPTTVFTFGLFWFLKRPFPRYVLVIPLIWAIVGGSAAITLGVVQDLGLIAAGLSGIVMLFAASRVSRMG